MERRKNIKMKHEETKRQTTKDRNIQKDKNKKLNKKNKNIQKDKKKNENRIYGRDAFDKKTIQLLIGSFTTRQKTIKQEMKIKM